jgi:hypothetical protein
MLPGPVAARDPTASRETRRRGGGTRRMHRRDAIVVGVVVRWCPLRHED